MKKNSGNLAAMGVGIIGVLASVYLIISSGEFKENALGLFISLTLFLTAFFNHRGMAE